MQAIGVYYVSAVAVPIVCTLVGCCWLLRTFVEDISNDLANFDTNDSFHQLLDQNEIIENFNNAVQSFIVVKQLSNQKSTI